MLICLSGRYIEQELALQFGQLPPAFLPVGTSRLFALQIAKFGRGEACFISLPDDFNVPESDAVALAGLGANIIRTAADLSLNDAIRTILDGVDADEPVRIIFGDTLVDMQAHAERATDFVAVKETLVGYPWTFVHHEDGKAYFSELSGNFFEKHRAVCGYFSFSDLALLRESFSEKTLASALNVYSQRRSLKQHEAEQWYDFGHVTLFHRSKRDLLVARTFNTLRSDGHSITKTSSQTQKVRAEAEWYEHLPDELALHTPRFLGRVNEKNKAGYRLEYLYVPTLSDIHVFGRLPSFSWSLILSQCLSLLERFSNIRPETDAPEADGPFADRFYDQVFLGKTWARIDEFCKTRGLPVSTRFTINDHLLPPLDEIIEHTLSLISRTAPSDICFWHGDFFFGNLFFDFATQRIQMVDPRGQFPDGTFSRFGDRRYDLGKLAHSIVGNYDVIISGRSRLIEKGPDHLEFSLDQSQEHPSALAKTFLDLAQSMFGIPEAEIRAISASMFFSMLPLHHDDETRQMSLLASGLDQYRAIQGLLA